MGAGICVVYKIGQQTGLFKEVDIVVLSSKSAEQASRLETWAGVFFFFFFCHSLFPFILVKRDFSSTTLFSLRKFPSVNYMKYVIYAITLSRSQPGTLPLDGALVSC